MPAVALSAAAALAAFAPPVAAAQCGADRYACAAAAYRNGDLRAARAEVDALLAAGPDNADALLLSGLLWMRDGQPARAKGALDRAARVAPGYADVLIARARLNLRLGQRRAAARDVSRALVVAPGHAEAAALRADLARQRAPAVWTASLAQSISRLSPRRSTAWYETLGTVSHRRGATAFAVEAEHARRFGTSDVRIQLRGERAFGSAALYAAAAATLDPDFRESWGLRAGGSYAAGRDLDLLLDGRYSNYGDVASGSVAAGGRAWFADRRASVRATLINFIDETGDYRAGLAMEAGARLATRARLQAGYARYPETEAGVTRRVSILFAGLAYDVNERLSLHAGAEHEDRRGAYRRNGLTLGVTTAF